MTEDAQIVVADAPERQRFEVTVGRRARRLPRLPLRQGLLALIHTEVEDRFEGRGLGGRLARFALDRARAEGVSPSSPSAPS